MANGQHVDAAVVWRVVCARRVSGTRPGTGESVIQAHVPMQRAQRDIQALANHAIMHPQTTTELYGRVLCGQEPNTLLY